MTIAVTAPQDEGMAAMLVFIDSPCLAPGSNSDNYQLVSPMYFVQAAPPPDLRIGTTWTWK